MTGVDVDLGKGNKKGFCKYTGKKRKTRETMRPWLSVAWDLRPKDMEKAEILNTIFASVFNGNVCSGASQLFESSGRDWEGDTWLTGKAGCT